MFPPYHRPRQRASTNLTLVALLLSACGEVPGGSDQGTLVFSGDIILGRRIAASRAPQDLLGNVAPLLGDADLALANAEGVVSGGGRWAHKGELAPILYRAPPWVASTLAAGGLDVLTVGNNHAGDYGPQAFLEMLDRFHGAGMATAGGGETLTEAREPAWVRAGDTVVAVVGVDLTGTTAWAATEDRPGTLSLSEDPPRQVVSTLSRIARRARRHAHLVVLSPHWGANWETAPTAARRELARDLLDAGYDAILGHSAHVVQGVEVVDGKPVVYDAGNLLLDGALPGEPSDGVLFRLSFQPAGFTSLEAIPLALGESRVDLASGERARITLARLAERSGALGTVWDATHPLPLDPGDAHRPSTPPPVKAPPAAVREAPGLPLEWDTLPPQAHPLDTGFDNGIRLVGWRLLLDALPDRRTGQAVSTYWTTPHPLADTPLWIHLEARGADGKRDVDLHLPGDWRLPASRWSPGKIVEDTVFMRVTVPGPVTFLVGLEGQEGLLSPGLTPLATVPRQKGAPGVFQVLGW